MSLDPGLVVRVDEAAKGAGQSRSVWLERAALAALGDLVNVSVAAGFGEPAGVRTVERSRVMRSDGTPVDDARPVRREGESVVAFNTRHADWLRKRA